MQTSPLKVLINNVECYEEIIFSVTVIHKLCHIQWNSASKYPVLCPITHFHHNIPQVLLSNTT